jgi:pyruvate, orthophosphate dikinase
MIWRNESARGSRHRAKALLEGNDDGWLEDAPRQLEAAARAVYRSWMSARARAYRRLQGLERLPGTAVTVQAMVFGNGGLASGAGVAFSRDPSSGAPHPVIDLVLDAQGEDVVSGRRTPDTEETIARAPPMLVPELSDVLQRLEREFLDVQDVEFTVENGKLWMLQTSAAKRTPRAALKIAIDLVHEGLIDQNQALARIADIDLESLVEVSLAQEQPPVQTGIAASGGIAVGRAAFEAARAERLAAGGDPVILMRPDTSTADVAGFAVAAGIVTAVGARTAHAALVARQMGKPCIVGCGDLAIDVAADRASVAGQRIAGGDWITIDGDSGRLFLGRLATVATRPEAELTEIANWRARLNDRGNDRRDTVLQQLAQGWRASGPVPVSCRKKPQIAGLI